MAEAVAKWRGLVEATATSSTPGPFSTPSFEDTHVASAVREVEKEMHARIEHYRGHGDGLRGVTTGLASLNRISLGWRPGDVVVVAGGTGAGKSALAVWMALHAADSGWPVLYFSLEMSRDDWVHRCIAASAGIDTHKLGRGALDDSEFTQVAKYIKALGQFPIFIDDRPSLSTADILSTARHYVHQHGVRMIMVDYLQLIEPERGHENRNAEMTEVSRHLVRIARELDVPLIAISQLSREYERRGDSRPRLSDLRDSGAIEGDAAAVLFISRVRGSGGPLSATLTLAKNRGGPTGSIEVQYDCRTGQFWDVVA